MLMMFEVEWDVLRILSQQNDSFAKRVRVPYLIKHVRVPPGHIRHDYVGLANLIKDPFEHAFPEDLFIQAFCVSSDILSRSLNAKFINVVEFGVEGHQDEYEWFRGRRNWLSIHFRLLKRIQRKDNRHSRYSASEGKRKK